MAEKLIWSRLKSMRCPECNRNLCGSLLDETYQCEANATGACTFSIGKEKFDKYVDDMYGKPKQQFQSEDDRLAELNNLGREIEDDHYKQPDN